MSIPVTGVTVGQTSVVGAGHSFENTTDSFTPVGFESAVVSSGHFLYEGGGNGIVQFIFDTAYDEQTPLNIPFYFGPGLITTGLSAGTDSRFGGGTVENVSASFAPVGFESSELGAFHRVYDGAGNGVIDFLFVDTYTQQSPLNIPFPFGVGGFVISGVSAGSDSRFGGAAFENTADQLIVEGIAPSNAFGIRPVVGFEPPVDFFFVDAYPTQTPLNIPFYFGPGLTFSAGDLLSSAVGGHLIENDAATVAPAGFESSEVSRSFVYFDGQNGVNVDFKFVQSYNPGQGQGQFPNSLNVPFYFEGQQSLQVGGINSLLFGVFDIFNLLSIAEPVGIDSQQFGFPEVEELIPFDRTFTNWTVGASAVAFGDVVFGNRTYYFFNPGFANEVSFGADTFLAPYFRYLDLAGSGVSVDAYGDAFVAYDPRYLEPEGIFFDDPLVDQLGFPEVFFSLQTIVVNDTGDYWPSATVSEGTTVQDDTQTLALSVGDTLLLGEAAEVFNYAQLVDGVSLGAETTAFLEIPILYNYTRYLNVYWIEQEQFFPNEQVNFPKFGQSSWYNANRTIVAQGIARDPYFTWGALTKVFNNARILFPGSIYEVAVKPRWESDLFVSFAERFLSPSGLDSLLFGRANNTRFVNAAFLVEPAGFLSSFVPKPFRIFDPTQSFGGFDGIAPTNLFGTAFVADAIRSLFEAGGIAPRYPQVLFPTVGLTPRLVSPEGIDSFTYGPNTSIYEQITTATPLPIYNTNDQIGTATLVNVTPQLFLTGLWSTRPGQLVAPIPDPFIAYAIRTIALDFRHSIAPTNIIVKPTIANRDRPLYIPSVYPRLQIQTHTFQLTNIPEDFDQRIWFPQVVTFAGSPQQEASRFGGLEFRGPLYPEGIEPPNIDGPTFTLMGISYEWVTLSMTGSTMGVPTFVVPRYILASVNNENDGFPLFQDPNDGPSGQEPLYEEGGPLSEFGTPRISPWTIYLTQLDPPLTAQAQANNPGLLWQPIPTTINNEVPGSAWGRAKFFIPGVDQYVDVSPVEPEEFFGLIDVSNFIRTLRLADKGIFDNPFGYPTFPTTLKIYPPSFQTPDDYEMGEDIEFLQEQVPFEQTISPPGLSLTTFEGTLIELFNRDLPVQSLSDSVTFGDNNPMVYFYPRGFEAAGFQSFETGEDTFIDFAIRYLQMDGFDSFTMENDGLSGEFNDRLRFEIGRLYINPEGIDSFEAGATRIDLRYQYVRCYMIPPPRCLGEPEITQP